MGGKRPTNTMQQTPAAHSKEGRQKINKKAGKKHNNHQGRKGEGKGSGVGGEGEVRAPVRWQRPTGENLFTVYTRNHMSTIK